MGDYVNYDPTEGVSTNTDLQYTSSSEKTGYSSSQSFDASAYKNANFKWQILDVKDGKVRLISEKVVGPGSYTNGNYQYFYLRGKLGYTNGIDELNKICAIFGHGKGAENSKSIVIRRLSGNN